VGRCLGVWWGVLESLVFGGLSADGVVVTSSCWLMVGVVDILTQ